MADAPKIVIRHRHEQVGDVSDFHEWVFIRWIKCDKLGRPNHRMFETNWQFWRCNNVDCPGEAVVSDDFIRAALDGAE